MDNYVGKFVWLTGKTYPTPGEYFVVKETPFEFYATRLTGGYGTEIQRFSKRSEDPKNPDAFWRVVDAYVDDQSACDAIAQCEYFSETLKRGEKAQWVESVYSNAASAARLARRAIDERRKREGQCVSAPVLRTSGPYIPDTLELNGVMYDRRKC